MKELWYVKPRMKMNEAVFSIIQKMEADSIFIQVESIPKTSTNWKILKSKTGEFVGEMAFGGWIVKNK